MHTVASHGSEQHTIYNRQTAAFWNFQSNTSAVFDLLQIRLLLYSFSVGNELKDGFIFSVARKPVAEC